MKKKIILSLIFLSLFASHLEAATYYVSNLAGNDSNSCATAQSSTPANAKFTISAGVACLSAGDTLYIRAGTYTSTSNSINSGATTVNGGTNFGAGAIWIGAYPTEIVTITVGGGSGGNAITLTSSTQKYIIFDHLILDGTGMGSFAGGLYAGNNVSHIKFQYGEIKNSPGQGVLNTDSTTDLEILISHVHDNGGATTPHTHGIYLSGSDNIVDGCEIDHNASNGIVFYNVSPTPQRNIARNNYLHDNASIAEAEITVGGSNNQVYNNIIAGYGTGYSIYIGYSTPINNLVYNNTFVHRQNPEIQSDAVGTEFKNNIFRTLGNAGAGALVNNGTGTTTATNSTVDPTFTNVGGGFLLASDFNIQTSSADKDAGTTLAIVTTDYTGLARPQNSLYDIGAYEFPAPPDTTPPTVLAVIPITPDGTYNAGSVITIQITFSEAVIITGNPIITLETGTTDRTAVYTSGTNFQYTVVSGDSSSDLDYHDTGALTLSGGTIKDAAGNNATLTLASPGVSGSLGANAAIIINTTVPVASVSARRIFR